MMKKTESDVEYDVIFILASKFFLTDQSQPNEGKVQLQQSFENLTFTMKFAAVAITALCVGRTAAFSALPFGATRTSTAVNANIRGPTDKSDVLRFGEG